MKIAQILPELNVGGVERGTVDLARALKRRGHEPCVISNGGRLTDELLKAGVPHLKLPVHKKSLFSLSLVGKLAAFIERERIDVIHARSRVPAWLAYLAVRRTNCDFVTTCHGYYSKHFASRVMGWGKRVIVTSHSIGRRMIDDFGVSPERIRLIHRGVDLSQFSSDPDKYDRPLTGPYRIVNVGRITPIKGHENFIRAVHLLSKRLSDLEVSIVGGPDEGKERYFRELKLLVGQLGLEGKIRFLGARPDVPDLIKRSDLLVLSSTIPEAFGRVLIEAGAVGTAVAASRIGGILDVVDEDENGLLFAPENFEEMAARMETLLRDRRLAKKLSSRLRQKVETQFALETMVEKTCEVYEEVKRQKRILVTKLSAVGDLVLAVPSFRMLRNRYPSAYLALLSDPEWLPLVQNCPYLNECLTFRRGTWFGDLKRVLQVGRWLRKRAFDFSVDLQNNWRTHALCFAARIPKRYGYRRGWSGALLTHPVIHWDKTLGPVEHQFQVLRRAGVAQIERELELWTNPSSEEKIQALFEESKAAARKYAVGFVLGASPRWPTKQWPVGKFVQLGKELCASFDCTIVLIGSETNDSLARDFAERAKELPVLNLVAKTTLPELVSVMKRLNVVVSGDSAPLHIGAGASAKIVALFGPTDPKRHMPPAKDHVLFYKRIPCQPCYKGVCKNSRRLECLESISPQEVAAAVSAQLKETPAYAS